MAREEQDREDLLRDATALVRRVELSVDGFDQPAFVGFRSNGAASFYFDQDPVYHFNSTGQLRRAFLDGRLLKAEKGHLVGLERRRAGGEVQLLRHELTDSEAEHLLANLKDLLARLLSDLLQNHFQVIGQVPDSGGVAEQIRDWLTEHPTISIAQSAAVS